ncbi:zeta toxin family protein [Schaalia sp. ZJ1691]|uniref:zeta toxin family protein n=1 Tax=Schaalia sp. ZJ1691 TaxID=2709404 RepID=UPI0013EB2995|nr:zeta toxin family protein [Schaalia sp. ZJ1691]
MDPHALFDAQWLRVQQQLFGTSRVSSQRVIVSIGGQPGSGKTHQLEQLLRDGYSSIDIIPVIGDELRLFHPEYSTLVNDPDPEVMPRKTAEFSARMVEKSLAYAQEHSYSVAVEGTMRRPKVTLGTLKDFHNHGFATHLVVLAVPEAISWQGCVMRFVQPYLNGQAARWAPKTAHDAGYLGTQQTLETALLSPHIDRLTVMSRSGDTLYDSAAATTTTHSPLDALTYGRTTLTHDERTLWLSNQQFINDAFAQLPANIRNEILQGPTIENLTIRDENESLPTRSHSLTADLPIVLPGVGERPDLSQSSQPSTSTSPVKRQGPTNSRGQVL